jgi:glycerol-3-phosphate O-acyltransferase / dihydroxyacetone phosphate acyltransferase
MLPMRRLLGALLRRLVEALVRLYYPRRSVEGGEHLPAAGPVLYVLNHPNGLLDPLVLRIAARRPVRFLAKSTLFGNALGRLAMEAFGCLPVYRTQDRAAAAGGGDGGRHAAGNEETFARCRAALARGEALALFPEGTSHSDPRLRPLKTGAARIALSSAAAGVEALRIVPVGLHYEDKVIFRSGVHLLAAPPLALGPYLPGYAAAERQEVDRLTDDIRARLDDVVLQAETRELLAGIARVASWTADEPDDDEPARRHARARELVAAYARLKAVDPARVEAVAAAARQYARILAQLGVGDPWQLEAPRISLGGAALALGRAALMAPAALWGALTSWIPYRLAGRVAARVTSDEDVLSTVKLLAGAAFLGLAWAIEAAALALVAGPWWGALALAVAPAAGYAALRFEETLRGVSESLRHVGLRARRPEVARRLAERRRLLADDVARALREAPR